MAAQATKIRRVDAVSAIVEAVGADTLVVFCNGMIAREAWTAGDRPSHFYMIGSMGLALSISLGLALVQPRRRVMCVDGDGNLLMGLGALASAGAAGPPNLYHVVLDNQRHASTGGQRTISDQVSLESVARACGYAWTARAVTRDELRVRLRELFGCAGPACLVVEVAPGNVGGIGRVGRTPRQIADDFRASALGEAS
jgi:thiamine pyrophosphate-dependent acetolactate synthase large subunit-like protein